MSKLFGAPIYLETIPMKRLPIGIIPKAAMAKKLMTLPLMALSASSCKMVLQIGISDIVPNPQTIATAIAIGKIFKCEKIIKLIPKIIVFINNTLLRLVLDFKEAKYIAAITAPKPIKLLM